MQSIKKLQLLLEELPEAKTTIFTMQDFYAVFSELTITNLRMLLSRAVKKGSSNQ